MTADRSEARAVIFDMDGTLVQTRVSSWEVFRIVSQRFGLGIDTPQQYFDLMQDNIFAAIGRLCRDEAHAEQVRDAFLALLREQYAPPLVPGIAEVVRMLAGQCTLAVISSNATEVLRRILVDNRLAYCFAHVFGGDVVHDKRAAIRAFLDDSGNGFRRRCAADYDESGVEPASDPATTVLVTDTVGDVRAAAEAGIRSVGVAWGMHSADELTAAGAEFVALWPQELIAHLLGARAGARPAGACALPGEPAPTGAGQDCGCGCDGTGAPDAAPSHEVAAVTAAGAVRRARRRAAALRAAGGTEVVGVGSDLLDAVRRILG